MASIGQSIGQGLCGQLVCRRLCLRSQYCPAGNRRADQLLAARAVRRFTVRLDKRRGHICEQIHDSGHCPELCLRVGGCFLPQAYDHPSEAKRKAFRAQRAMDALVRSRAREAARV